MRFDVETAICGDRKEEASGQCPKTCPQKSPGVTERLSCPVLPSFQAQLYVLSQDSVSLGERGDIFVQTP